MDFLRFKESAVILKVRIAADLVLSKQILQEQQAILLTEKDNIAQDTRRVNMNSFKTNQSLNDRIAEIRSGELADHIANLRSQQQHGMDSAVGLLTVSRIIEKNREINRIQKSIQNNTLLTEKRARILLKVIEDIASITREITLLDDCILVSDFFTAENLKAVEVADYDFERLYTAFNTGV
jgi:hypothetical protein